MKTAEIVVTETKGYAEVTLFNNTRVTVYGELADVENVLQTRFDLPRDAARTERVVVERVGLVPALTQLVSLTKNNQPIAAIKRLRELTGIDLKSAKDLIDLMGHHGWATGASA